MESLMFLLPIALFISFLGILGVIWSVNNKQYEDLRKESEKILYEDQDKQKKEL